MCLPVTPAEQNKEGSVVAFWYPRIYQPRVTEICNLHTLQAYEKHFYTILNPQFVLFLAL